MPLAFSLAFALLTQADPPKAPLTPIDVVSALETTLSDAIAKAQPSVVAISRIKSDDDETTTAIRGRNPARGGDDNNVFVRGRIPGEIDFDDFALPGDFGSGVVIGDHGEILTVYHIVKGASQIRVRASGQPAFDAEVLAADPRTDLAVIAPREAPGMPAPKLKPLAISDASKLRPGSFLLALGNPYNAARDGKSSASWGILSNVARKFEAPPDQRAVPGELRYHPTLLQLDAKLNLGMSGGAVINLKGELVGITTAAGSPVGFDAQAGYAIPMDALGRRAVEALREGKEVEYAFLGIQLNNQFPNRISGVKPGTPAAEGKLLVDDQIVEVGGVPVDGEGGLAVAMATAPVGKPVSVKVARNGEIVESTIHTSKFPVPAALGEVIVTNRPRAWRGVRVDYTSVVSGSVISDDVLNAMAKGGVGVVDVETGSSADAAGLKKGQVITKIEGRSVRNPAEFAKVIADLKGPAKLDTDLGPVTIK